VPWNHDGHDSDGLAAPDSSAGVDNNGALNDVGNGSYYYLMIGDHGVLCHGVDNG